MLLNIRNLPHNTKYSDIKALVRATCGIEDMIMDNLMMYDHHSKQVTIGLANEDDAAVLIRKLDGFYMDGHQLQVAPKTKAQPPPPAPAIPPLMSLWNSGKAPAMVPSPANYSKVNQTIPFYQLNQPSFQTGSTSSTSKTEFLTYPLGNASRKVNREVSWTEQDTPIQNQEATWDHPKWDDDRGSRKDDNRSSRRDDNRGSRRDDRGSRWDDNRDFRLDDNRGSRRDDNRGFRRDESRGSRKDDDRSSRRDDDYGSRRDNSRGLRGDDDRGFRRADDRGFRRGDNRRSRNDDNRGSHNDDNLDFRRDETRGSRRDDNRGPRRADNRGSRRDNKSDIGNNRGMQRDRKRAADLDISRDSKRRNIREPEQNNDLDIRRDDNDEPEWDNNQDTNWTGDYDMRWDSNPASTWNSNPDPTWNSNPELPWNNNPDSSWNNMPAPNSNLYVPNQPAKFPVGDSSYTGYDQDCSQPYNVYGSHVTDLSNTNYDSQVDMSHQYQNIYNRSLSPDEQQVNRSASPYGKRVCLPEPPQTSQPAQKRKKKSKGGKANTGGVLKTLYNHVRQLPNPIPQEYPEPDEKQRRKSEMWRAQLAGNIAKHILDNKLFEYTGVTPADLQQELKRVVRTRLQTCFKDNYAITMKEMHYIYQKKYASDANNCVLLREAVTNSGGTLVTPVKAKAKKAKKGKIQLAPQYGTVYGNLKVDHRNDSEGPAQQLQPAQLSTAIKQPGPAQFVQNPVTIPQNPQGGVRNPQPQIIKNIPKGPVQQHHKVKQNPGSVPLAQIPGRIPQYPNGDKQQFKEQKKNTKEMFTSEDYVENIMANLKTSTRAALDVELEELNNVVVEACKEIEESSSTETDADEATMIKRMQVVNVPKSLQRMMKINLTRRLVPILPIGVRIYAVPPIKRPALEQFLLQFNASVVMKSKQSLYYVAYLQNFEDHDKLCATKNWVVDDSVLTFKPLHMAGIKEKTTKTAILKQRMQIKQQHLAHFKSIFGNDTPKEPVQLAEHKQLAQDMKQLQDEINNPIDFTADDPIQDTSFVIPEPVEHNYDSPLKSASSDLAAQSNISTIMDNLNEAGCLPVIEDKVGDGMPIVDDENDDDDDDDDVKEHTQVIETVDLVDDDEEPDSGPAVDDIDLADVNDDDLEDW